MESFIIVVIGLVLGYFFVSKYKKIDCELFSRFVYEYNSFGVISLIASMFLGGLIRGSYMFPEMFDADWNNVVFIKVCLLCAIGLYGINVFLSIYTMPTWGARVGKIGFSFLTILLGILIGVASSVIIIVLIILYLFVKLIAIMLSHESKIVKDPFGNKKTLKKGLLDSSWKDSSGQSYTRSGKDFYKNE